MKGKEDMKTASQLKSTVTHLKIKNILLQFCESLGLTARAIFEKLSAGKYRAGLAEGQFLSVRLLAFSEL